MATAKRDDGKLLKIFRTCPGVFSRPPHLCGRKKRDAPSNEKKKNKFFFLPNPQREGISTGRWGTSPPAASLVSSAFLEKTIFFFAFLFYAMLYFTRLPFPLLTLPILSFGGSCQLQIDLWLASGCHLFDEWLPSGCHPIKWPAKRKIGDRGKPECTAPCAKRRTAFPP